MRFNPASIIKIKIVLVFLFISFNLKDNLELAIYDNQLITFMPIDTAQQALHIRRKKNTQVFRNIARLWDAGQKSQTDQELLNALHPWREDHNLRFVNTLSYLLSICSITTLLFGYFFILIFNIFGVYYGHFIWFPRLFAL